MLVFLGIGNGGGALVLDANVELFVTDVDASKLANFCLRLNTSDPELAVRFVRGQKMRSVEALFDEVSSAFQFPYYFGENWAALDECIRDLSWISSKRFLLVIGKFESVLNQDVPARKVFGSVLRAAIVEMEKEGRSLQIVVQCSSIDSLCTNNIFGANEFSSAVLTIS